MTKATDEQLLRLWRSSYALSRAAFIFASPEDQAKWKALKDVSAIEAFQAGAVEASKGQPDFSAAVIQAMKAPSKILRDRAEHTDKLQQDVLKFIEGGLLHGFGFEPPRRLDSVPVPIPKRAWSDHIDWEKNSLTFESMQFVEVRLTTNRIRNEILERGQVDKTPVNAPGRPGVRSDIEDAFQALKDTGSIDPKASQSSHYPRVRAWLERNRPDLDVPPAQMSEKTIHKYFSPLFNELKKNHNL